VQHARVDTAWRFAAELVAPQTMGLPRRLFVPCEADHIRPFARLNGELEVLEDDLLEVT